MEKSSADAARWHATTYGGCHSVFIDDFKLYSEFVFAIELWISRDVAFFIIPCINHDSMFAINLMRLSWIHWRCRLHTLAVTQYSLTISSSTVTLFLLTIYGSALTYIFYDSMRPPWLYLCHRFDVSVMNSWMLSIPCGSYHLIFIDNFKVCCYSVLAGDLWISRDIVFLIIRCLGHDSIFAIDLMRRSWIHWRCRFHSVAVTQYSLTISRSTVPFFWPAIYGLAMT